MLNLNSAIDINFKQFFRWWRRELEFLLPEKIKQIIKDSQGVSYDLLLANDRFLLFPRPLVAGRGLGRKLPLNLRWKALSSPLCVGFRIFQRNIYDRKFPFSYQESPIVPVFQEIGRIRWSITRCKEKCPKLTIRNRKLVHVEPRQFEIFPFAFLWIRDKIISMRGVEFELASGNFDHPGWCLHNDFSLFGSADEIGTMDMICTAVGI